MKHKHFPYDTIKDTVVDSYGRRVVLSLFKEFKRGEVEFEPLWSLKDEWRKIYLDVADPTEYETAMCLIGDWEHYQLIRNHPKIKPIMDKWAREVEVKLRSGAVMNMFRHAQSPNGASAAKWIAEGAFMGRVLKNKEEKQAEEAVREEMSTKISEDMARLGLKLVSGGGK